MRFGILFSENVLPNDWPKDFFGPSLDFLSLMVLSKSAKLTLAKSQIKDISRQFHPKRRVKGWRLKRVKILHEQVWLSICQVTSWPFAIQTLVTHYSNEYYEDKLKFKSWTAWKRWNQRRSWSFWHENRKKRNRNSLWNTRTYENSRSDFVAPTFAVCNSPVHQFFLPNKWYNSFRFNFYFYSRPQF